MPIKQVLLQGKYPVKIYTDDIEEKAREQLENISNMPFIHHHVAVMPDVHYGIGATIGSVIPTIKAIIPSAVGVDIGCVSGDTEFLTTNGWKKISEYKEGDEVLVYSPKEKIAFFSYPTAYIDRPSKGFYKLRTKYGINQNISKDHKMLLYRRGKSGTSDSFIDMLAEDFVKSTNNLVFGSSLQIKTTPEKCLLNTSVPLSEAELRVVVMTAADAYIDRTKIPTAILHLKKQRKIDRARKLLAEASANVISDITNNECTTIRYRAITPTKSLMQLWGASVEQLSIIVEECLYWDGDINKRIFHTRKEAEADFIQWAFLVSGYRAVKRIDIRSSGIDYRVFAYENKRIAMKSTEKRDIRFNIDPAREYCFTVETGYFLIRHEGITAITGNCGMGAIKTSVRAEHLPDSLTLLRSAIEGAVPHGISSMRVGHSKGNWDKALDLATYEWSNLSGEYNALCKEHKAIKHDTVVEQLGTLGGGNHFIELCLDEEGFMWVMLHSGSRGVGNRIGRYFIEQAKLEMERYFIHLPDKDLAYLVEGSELFEDYIDAVWWTQNYALTNRRLMMRSIMSVLNAEFPGLTTKELAVECHHNYVELENHFGRNVWLTRKGAIRVRDGDLGIIPGSMGTKSYIVKGKGNSDSFCSCSHGAGRKLGRKKAEAQFTLADLAEQTKGVECRKDAGVLDEIPRAYKDIDEVMENQSDLVDIVHTLKAVLTVKG